LDNETIQEIRQLARQVKQKMKSGTL
jgi:hypothetical protein